MPANPFRHPSGGRDRLRCGRSRAGWRRGVRGVSDCACGPCCCSSPECTSLLGEDLEQFPLNGGVPILLIGHAHLGVVEYASGRFRLDGNGMPVLEADRHFAPGRIWRGGEKGHGTVFLRRRKIEPQKLGQDVIDGTKKLELSFVTDGHILRQGHKARPLVRQSLLRFRGAKPARGGQEDERRCRFGRGDHRVPR